MNEAEINTRALLFSEIVNIGWKQGVIQNRMIDLRNSLRKEELEFESLELQRKQIIEKLKL